MAQQVQTVGGNFNSDLPCDTKGIQRHPKALLWHVRGPVLDHAETFLQPCLEPYSSHINLTCRLACDLSNCGPKVTSALWRLRTIVSWAALQEALRALARQTTPFKCF